jgi:hypothetical protein
MTSQPSDDWSGGAPAELAGGDRIGRYPGEGIARACAQPG